MLILKKLNARIHVRYLQKEKQREKKGDVIHTEIKENC